MLSTGILRCAYFDDSLKSLDKRVLQPELYSRLIQHCGSLVMVFQKTRIDSTHRLRLITIISII